MEISGYDAIAQLADEGQSWLIAEAKLCLDWVSQNGRNVEFKAKAVLQGAPVLNFNSLAARGILRKVRSTRRGALYVMPDPDGVGRALGELGIKLS